jgi:photosystem II stability/assembly factor-like uncharacterized protein
MKKLYRQIPFIAILILMLLPGVNHTTYAQSTIQQVLFSDDFEKGLAMPWDWDPGWTVDIIDSNHVLHGKGHIWITLAPDEELGEIMTFESRVNLLKGSIHVNYRINLSGSRYFVRMESGRILLLKMGRTDITPIELSSQFLPISYGTWYSLRITSIDNHLQVYLDDTLQLDYTDEDNPYPSGTIAFESLDESDVLVDDVVLNGQLLAATPPGLTWTFTGGPRGGIGYDIRFNPLNQKIVWVTDAFAGAHQSMDGGLTWIARNDGIDARSGASGDAIPVFSLTIDPNNPETLWAGVMGKRGLYKSTDGGQTWVRKDNGIVDQPNMEMRGITVDPNNSNVVYCGGNYLVDEVTLDQRGFIYKSTDGGENWNLLIEPDALVRWIIVDPTDTNILYASTGIFDRYAVKPTGVLKSLDGGQTWGQINNGFTSLVVAALAMDPEDHLTLIAGTGKASLFADEPNEINGGVFITHDGGQNWVQVDPIKASGDNSKAFSAVAFAPSNPKIIYADAGYVFLHSEDGGESWESYFVGPDLSSGMLENRGQPIALAVNPTDPNEIFMNAYDGGVFVSADGGKTWQDSSKGNAGSQVWGVALDPSEPAFVAAVSKNGMHISYDAGSTWHGRISEGGINNLESVAIDPKNRNNILIGRSITADLSRSIDGGFTWERVLGPLGQDIMYGRRAIHEISFSPSSPEIVYVATGIETLSNMGVTRDTPGPGIFKSLDGGATWSVINHGLENTTLNIMAVAVHPQNPEVAYLGEINNGVYKTLDGGSSWTPANNGLQQTDIRALAIDPQDPNTVYAGAEFGGVWKSEDGGDSWKNISSGMFPESSVRSLVIDPIHPNNLYAADMQSGVYRSTDSGGTWQQLRSGLKVKAIHGLAISADGQTLYAATEGNGVYRLDLSGQPPVAVPEITLEDFLGIADSPIQVDGLATDWVGRRIVVADPAGDAEEGFLDFSDGYAFHDGKALYFLVETVDPEALYVQFDIQFTAGVRKYIISVDPISSSGFIGDITSEYQAIGQTNFSKFSYGPALEGRIDLRDLGSPDDIHLESIGALIGECCNSPSWHQADIWEIQGQTPLTEESWVNPTPELSVEEPVFTPTASQMAGNQAPSKNETQRFLLPILIGLILIVVLVSVIWVLRKDKHGKVEK